MRNPNGINRLARVLDSRMTQRLQRPDVLELGTIQSDMSLKLDRFPIPIPKEDYLVCRTLTLPDPLTETDGGWNDEEFTDPFEPEVQHWHKIKRPPELAPLKPGDRVLVAWVNNGTDPVVIDVVVKNA